MQQKSWILVFVPADAVTYMLKVHTLTNAAGGGASSGTGTGEGGGAAGAVEPFVPEGMMTGTGVAEALIRHSCLTPDTLLAPAQKA